jgi:hypothetical protein
LGVIPRQSAPRSNPVWASRRAGEHAGLPSRHVRRRRPREALVARIRAHGAQLIGELLYEGAFRLAYIRGPERALSSRWPSSLARCASNSALNRPPRQGGFCW